MTYKLIKFDHGKTESEIDKVHAENIIRAKWFLIELLSMEEKYDIIIQNYKEFELLILELTLNHQLYRGKDWSDIKGELLEVNRKLINVLTSTKLYIDQLKHSAKIVFESSSQDVQTLDNYISAQYDSNPSYRFFEALRNHVQHRDLPIHRIRYNENVYDETKELSEFNINVHCLVKNLMADKKFKKQVLVDLGSQDKDYIDIKYHLRKYIQSIGIINDFVRERAESKAEEKENLICSLLDSYGCYNKPYTKLSIIIESESRSEDIFIDFKERRRYLQKRNKSLIGLHRLSLTNK